MVFGSRRRLLSALSLVVPAIYFSPASMAQVPGGDVFTGTVRLACEAVVCLSSSAGGATSTCDSALSHFYGIKKKKLSDTLNARKSFLQQCPDASSTPEMATLVDAIAGGAGRCDAVSLNLALGSWHTDSSGKGSETISNQLPSYCNAYTQHEYTDLVDQSPRYIGTVEGGGYWVKPQNYDAELIKYQAAREIIKKAQEQSALTSGN